MTSAEKTLGIPSQPLTTAPPLFQIVLILFSRIVLSLHKSCFVEPGPAACRLPDRDACEPVRQGPPRRQRPAHVRVRVRIRRGLRGFTRISLSSRAKRG